MSEMIERVARALAYADLDEQDRAVVNMDMHMMYVEEHYNDLACAAIEAMREPTEGMKHANDEVHWGYSCNTCGGLTEGWYAMIDEALK